MDQSNISGNHFTQDNHSLLLECFLYYPLNPFNLAVQLQGKCEGLGESKRDKKHQKPAKENQKIINPFHITLLLCRVVFLPIFNLSCPFFVLILCHHLQFVSVHFTLINQPNTCTFLSENANVFTHSSS